MKNRLNQGRQTENITKIFDRLDVQGVALGKVETRLEDIIGLKKDVQENTKKISLIRGIGIAISLMFGAVLGFLGIK